MRLNSKLLAFALILSIRPLSGWQGCNSDNLNTRVVRAIGAIPSVVRSVFPHADKRVFDALDLASTAFKEFTSNPTISNYDHAVNIWNDGARAELLKFNAPVRVEFKESDVKALERAIKEARP